MQKRKILKILLSVALVLGLLLLFLDIGARLYRDKAGAYLHQALSRKTDLVVAPFRTSVSVWRHFPRLTFTFHHISFTDTSTRQPFRVLFVGQAEVALPLTQLWLGRLRIGRVTLNQVVFHQLVDPTGKKISLRFHQSGSAAPEKDKMDFVLRRLYLRNVRIINENQYKKSAFSLLIHDSKLTLKQNDQQLRLGGTLSGKINHLKSRKLQLFRGQAFSAQLDYTYRFDEQKGLLGKTRMRLNNQQVLIRGWHQPRSQGPGSRMNLTLSGTQPLMYLFRQVLPAQIQPFLERIRTKSQLQVVYRISGETGPTLRPRNQLSFALKNGTLYLPASRKYVRQVNLIGSMDNGPRHGPQSSTFRITHLSAGVRPRQFQLALQVTNFANPVFAIQGSGRMDLPAMASFVRLPLDSVSQGTVSGSFRLQGNLPDTLGRSNRASWRGKGLFRISKAGFQFSGLKARCRNVNARLQYTDSLLELQDLSGTLGGYPFKMQATVRNYPAYLFQEPGLIRSTVSIYARKLALSWLHAPVVEEKHPALKQSRPGRAAATRHKPAIAPGPPPAWQQMHTQVNLVVDHFNTPGKEQVKDLTVKVSQQGGKVTLSRMRFTTTRGGMARARGGFRLIPGGISRPYMDVHLHYASLDMQAFLQNLTAFKPAGNAGKRLDPDKKDLEDYLEKRYWLNLHVQAGRVRYLYLQGSQLHLRANINRQRARLTQLHLQTMGGQLDARGELQLNNPGQDYPLQLKLRVQQIDLPHLFRVAASMDLDLLSPRNIRGQADCRLALNTRLDETFSPSFARTLAYARTNFRNMELIEVAPIQQALRLLRQERTRHLYFEDVRASFILKDSTFLTPGVTLNSNLTDFRLSGVYTMGGDALLHIDVNVLSMLFGNNKRRIDKIRQDSTAAPADTAGAASGPMQHLLVSRQQDRYKVRPSSRRSHEQHAREVKLAFQQLLRHHGIDTTFRMP